MEFLEALERLKIFKTMGRLIIIILFIPFLYSGCGRNAANESTDTATYGSIKIAADESYLPIVQAQIDVFEALYPYAHITPIYKPEGGAFNELLRDSVRLVVAGRLLTADEKAVFEKAKITPRINKVAIDAVAVVVNNENSDSMLTVKQLEKILKGEYINWQQVSGKKNLKGDIKIVFDNSNSGNLRYMVDTFACDSSHIKQYFSAGGNKQVIDFVASNKNAMGIIGVNWISDGDDSTARSFTKAVKVVALSAVESPTSLENYYQPYQAYIATGKYPLSRNLYIISREARVGLGTGFASFVASDRGQKIILKAGLVPGTVPLRIVNLKNKMP